MELTLDLLHSSIEAVRALDAEIEKAKGTAAERRQKAIEAICATPEGSELCATIASIEAQLSALRQEFDDAITAHVKSLSANSATIEGLKAQRSKAIETANAVKVLLDSNGTDTSSVTMPSKSAPRIGSGSTRGVKTSGSRHYIVVDGERKFYSNTSFSYLAFALKMTQGNGGAEALSKAIADAGVTSRTVPWEATITIPEGERKGQTVTVGMVVDDTNGETNSTE
jgi:hypothetical protein